MRSMRVQLVAASAAGMAVVLLASGLVLYALIGRALRAEFDQALLARARGLAALVEQDDEGLESELDAAAEVDRAAGPEPEYYQVWLPDGRVFARSAALGSDNLSRLAEPRPEPRFRGAALPDGRPGRQVELGFAPRRDEQEPPDGTPLTLTLVAARGTAGLDATLAQLRLVLAGVGFGAVTLSAAGLTWVVSRQLRPLARLGEQIATVSERDLRTRFAGAGAPAELSPIVQRLNDLLARLEAAFERERRFTGDVAHELRTPLAGLRATLETALSRPREAEAYRRALESCLGVGGHMQRMVENLLQLARADAGQLPLQRVPVDIAEVLRACWAELAERAAVRRVSADWQVPNGSVIHADRAALQHICCNLLENAATYAEEGDVVRVSVKHDGQMLTLSVRNRTTLPPESAERVFERFWRADPARAHHQETHIGLGLPLCRALVRQLGGTIAASVSAEGVFEVVVRLPDPEARRTR